MAEMGKRGGVGGWERGREKGEGGKRGVQSWC